MTERDAEIPVVVVGAGPVGLAASVALSRWDIPHIVLERHPGTAIHPKARGVDVRTMETFRRWEMESEVLAAGLPAAEHGFFFRGATLTSDVFDRFGGGGQAGDAQRFSTASWLVIGQDALEPVLLARTRRLGASDVRFGHEVTDIAGDGAASLTTVTRRDTGEPYRISSRYVITAEGAGGWIRDSLGIPLVGRAPLVLNSSILFRPDLTPHIADRQSAVYYLTGTGDPRPRGFPPSVGNPPPNGALLAINNRDRWLLVVGHPIGDDSAPDAPTATALVRRAVGLDDLAVEILSVLPWAPAARVAERYRERGIFLVGDAAHEMTPSGAFGLNVGIQDADDLGWKLGAVLAGWGGPALLDTYEAERRPIAEAAAVESYGQFTGERPAKPFGNWGMILGGRYESRAIVPDGSPAADVADPSVDYIPAARPGHRFPHAALGDPAASTSTLDLLGRGFTLVTANAAWSDAGEALMADARSDRSKPPLEVRLLSGELSPTDPAAFEATFGIGEGGALLVRPDGVVGWRARSDDGVIPSEHLVAEALVRLSGG